MTSIPQTPTPNNQKSMKSNSIPSITNNSTSQKNHQMEQEKWHTTTSTGATSWLRLRSFERRSLRRPMLQPSPCPLDRDPNKDQHNDYWSRHSLPLPCLTPVTCQEPLDWTHITIHSWASVPAFLNSPSNSEPFDYPPPHTGGTPPQTNTSALHWKLPPANLPPFFVMSIDPPPKKTTALSPKQRGSPCSSSVHFLFLMRWRRGHMMPSLHYP